MKAKRAKPKRTLVQVSQLTSFFDEAFTLTPIARSYNKMPKRTFLKSALGAVALGGVNHFSVASTVSDGHNTSVDFNKLLQTSLWQTLDAVLLHLLPKSAIAEVNSDISSVDIHATRYLMNVMYQQPTAQDTKDFVLKGVGWLNGISQQQYQRYFKTLNHHEKETLLRKVSRSSAGEQWISTLINYIFEAMLSAPSYGGNPQGIGWQWLEHQPGYPLPPIGKRYFELPGKHRIFIKPNTTALLPQQLTYRKKA